MAKKYVLAAWTENGKVHMIPSLVNELSVPYRERIENLETRSQDFETEVGWLLAQSRAHENFARFLLRVGYPREAYIEYENAAIVCSRCSDTLWLQDDNCCYPTLPLLYRFLSMHRECVRLASSNPFLDNRYKGSELESLYRWFNTDTRILEREIGESLATLRAWRFGWN